VGKSVVMYTELP